MTFSKALEFVLRWEGGYVNHPADPGGATNQGITQKTYDSWRSRKGLVPRSVEQLTDVERDAIYRQDYWAPMGCDSLSWPLSLVAMDTAVNCGVGRARRMLEQAGHSWVAFISIRRAYYLALIASKPRLAVFQNGWMNRLEALEHAALAQA